VSSLGLRLQLAAFAALVAAFVLRTLLAPGVLLLEPGIASAALLSSAWVYPTVLALAVAVTFLRVRTLRPALSLLEQGELSSIDVSIVRQLHALPITWTIQIAALGTGVVAATLLPATRPPSIDLPTQVSFVMLTVTMIAAVSLPLYVVARAVVASAIEAMPWRLIEESMRVEDETLTLEARFAGRKDSLARALRRPPSRVTARLTGAVAISVAIVASGATLLVDAHVRAREARDRRDDAYALVRGVLEPVGAAGEAGRELALRAAEAHGFNVTVRPLSAASLEETPADTEGGQRLLRVRIEDGEAVVRFRPTLGGSPVELYVFAAALVVLVAAIVGRSLGGAVATDLGSASREVRLLGTRDVVRGATRVAGPARFDEVADLALGIEAVAERFREFAQGRERMIEARESAQRMRDLFLASMSHDLRSPLNGILGFVALIAKNELSGGQQESLKIIDRRGRELLELIENILDAAKLEAGKLELSREWIAPAEIAEAAVRRGRELAAEKGDSVDVIGELQPGLPLVLVDGHRLAQAVQNLVANAVKFCDRGVVRVRISHQAREGSLNRAPRAQDSTTEGIRIEVEDQGRGIPEKELAQIFDAFRQPIRSRRHGGLGLGLSITRALVELHGGTLDVESSPAHGSVFTLFVPSQRPPLDLEPPPSSVRTSSLGRPTPAPGLITPPPPSVHEDPTVQMPALEVPPESER